MYCEQCGQKNADQAVHCVVCGELVSTLKQNAPKHEKDFVDSNDDDVQAAPEVIFATPRSAAQARREAAELAKDQRRTAIVRLLFQIFLLTIPILLAIFLSADAVGVIRRTVNVSQLCNYGLVVGALLAFLVDWICFKFIYKTVTRTVETPDIYVRIVAALFPLVLYSSVMVATRSAAVLTNDQFASSPETEQLKLMGRIALEDNPDKRGRYFLNVEVDGKIQRYYVCNNTWRFLNPALKTYPAQIRMGYWGYKELAWQTVCPGEARQEPVPTFRGRS